MNTPAKNDWKGYDFDELLYRRILVDARIESQKAQLIETARSIQQQNPLTKMQNAGGIFRIVAYAEYAFMAIRLFKRVRTLFSKK